MAGAEFLHLRISATADAWYGSLGDQKSIEAGWIIIGTKKDEADLPYARDLS